MAKKSIDEGDRIYRKLSAADTRAADLLDADQEPGVEGVFDDGMCEWPASLRRGWIGERQVAPRTADSLL